VDVLFVSDSVHNVRHIQMKHFLGCLQVKVLQQLEKFTIGILDRNPLDAHKSAYLDCKEFFGLLLKPLYCASCILSSDVTV
jgi:hypothetical protein